MKSAKKASEWISEQLQYKIPTIKLSWIYWTNTPTSLNETQRATEWVILFVNELNELNGHLRE